MKTKIIVCVGLPGCGKTTWATQKESIDHKNKLKTRRINCDDHRGKGQFKVIKNNLKCTAKTAIESWDIDSNAINTIILDGLFNTNLIYQELIDTCPKADFEFRVWEVDRVACRHNDRYRRSLNSNTTIDRMIVEEPDLDKLKCSGTITVVREKTSMKSNYQLWIDKLRLNSIHSNCGVVSSDSWSGGGTWSNCWGDHGTRDAEDPVEFTDFDKILELSYPFISFLQYKRLRSECVSLMKRDISDYYNSGYSYSYECDMPKLYELLVQQVGEEELVKTIELEN